MFHLYVILALRSFPTETSQRWYENVQKQCVDMTGLNIDITATAKKQVVKKHSDCD